MAARAPWPRAAATASLLAAAIAQAQSPCVTGMRSAARCAELIAAEGLLARGDAAAATLAYERLAALEHAVDIEIGIVRSQIQAGEFRRALAFAAHTAGAHGSDADGAALYVRLLQLSGQAEFASRVRAQARTRVGDAALDAVVLPAPHAHGDAPPPRAVLVATGVLVDSGRRAVAPAQALDQATRVWLRDGHGLTVEARAVPEHSSPDIVVLELLRPLGPPQSAAVIAIRDPFPGAPAGVVAYGASDDARPAWPWLKVGFVGTPEATDASPRLNIDGLAELSSGGAVYDLTGRLVGLAHGTGSARRMLPVSAWQTDATATSASSQQPGARLALDALYEQALRSTLQVLVSR